MTSNKFETCQVNLEQLSSYSFIIPTYQRPYVWGEEEISKLITDLHDKFLLNPQIPFFVGTIITKENGTVAELIDGQQRFTTLWLIALVFSENQCESDLKHFLRVDKDLLRLGFEIRTEVQSYLNSLLSGYHISDNKVMTNDEIDSSPYLKNISEALVTIRGLINNKQIPKLQEFGNYIYEKLYFVKNTTPFNIDLNKVFSTINSAGVQLEQTDIVKANLLKRIDEKVMFSKIWESCENMNNFFERNVRESFRGANLKAVDFSQLVEFSREIFYPANNLLEDQEFPAFSINDLQLDVVQNNADATQNDNQNGNKKEDVEEGEVYCRSIINFGQLLLHTYRLHLKIEKNTDFVGTFHVNRLIEIFKSLQNSNDPGEIKRFFFLLWKVRYLFDKYIVKWMPDINTKVEHLELTSVSKNQKDHTYSRSNYEKGNMLMLQSVLYYTGDYLRQYWLTPYLHHLITSNGNLQAYDRSHLKFLEDIDNQLSLCKQLTGKEASFNLLSSDLEADFNYKSYLEQDNGTGFQHYWFQKLEYILYKNWPDTNQSPQFKKYRITSKNSVEHIYPQNPADPITHPTLSKEDSDSFGNLVLLSVSQNSEYGNKPVLVKKSMFKESSRSTYDTLKSYYIFEALGERWLPDDIKLHRSKMLDFLDDHYKYLTDKADCAL